MPRSPLTIISELGGERGTARSLMPVNPTEVHLNDSPVTLNSYKLEVAGGTWFQT